MDSTVFFESPAEFSVPCDVADRFLDAPETELRLILLLLRHRNEAFLKDDLLTALNVDEKRLEEAFRFWVKNGILFSSAGRYSLSRPKLTASDFMKYSPDTVAARLEGDAQLKNLYQDAESVLKKPLTSEDAAVLLSLVDWCGLPPEVVAVLVRYGTNNGMSLKNIQKTGIRWADNGVDTFEKANALIEEETLRKQTVNRVAARLGLLGVRAISEGEKTVFLKWTEEFGYDTDMVGAAYEATVKSAGKYSYPYMDKILTQWHDAGYTTPAQAAEAKAPARPAAKKGKASNPKRPAKTDASAVDWAWQIVGSDSEE